MENRKKNTSLDLLFILIFILKEEKNNAFLYFNKQLDTRFVPVAYGPGRKQDVYNSGEERDSGVLIPSSPTASWYFLQHTHSQ